MKWVSAAAYASALMMLVALASDLNDWRTARGWLLLGWAILLVFVVLGLFSHPMRWPAWGLFVGFWALVSAAWLLVLQVLATADVLRGSAYAAWAAWPLAVLAIWILLPSVMGFGNGVVARGADALGMLTGAGLLAITFATWTDSPNMARLAAGVTAILYSLWAVWMAQVFRRLSSDSPGR